MTFSGGGPHYSRPVHRWCNSEFIVGASRWIRADSPRVYSYLDIVYNVSWASVRRTTLYGKQVIKSFFTHIRLYQQQHKNKTRLSRRYTCFFVLPLLPSSRRISLLFSPRTQYAPITELPLASTRTHHAPNTHPNPSSY